MITVAYMTNREEPRIEWFMDAFHRQTGGNYSGIRVVVVDFHKEWRTIFGLSRIRSGGGQAFHVEPKPTVWQGRHRLTREDYFAAASARNTALCMAPDGHIVFVDDLSVPLDGWWEAVKEGTRKGRVITLGAYQKVLKLCVENGVVKSYDDHPPGRDIRMRGLSGTPPYSCVPGWHFGCSLVAPVEAYLEINGWPEVCDGLGYEDCITGIVLANNGWRFVYDTRMMTLESEEDHHVGNPMRRWDKGQSPNDKSHWLLSTFSRCRRFDNWFDPPGISALREKVLGGAPFPVMKIPEHDAYDGMPIREM